MMLQLNLPYMMVSIVEPIRWCVQHVVLPHLTDPRVFAVRIAVKFAFEAVVLNFGCCFTQVFVNFFVANGVINFDAGLSGSRTFEKIKIRFNETKFERELTRNVVLEAAELSILLQGAQYGLWTRTGVRRRRAVGACEN